MLRVAGKLLGLSTDGVLIDVESPVFFAQVVIGVAVGSPAGRAVLTVEVGELGELPVLLQPDVSGDGTCVMFAEGILIALDVVVEDVSTAVDAQVLHRQFREQACPAAIGAHLIHLRELAAGKEDGFCRGHVGGLEEHRLVVEETHRGLVTAVGGETLRGAAFLSNDKHVEASLACRGKGDALAIGAPDGVGIIGII